MLKVSGISFNSKNNVNNSRANGLMYASMACSKPISFKAAQPKFIIRSGYKFIETAMDGIFKSEQTFSKEDAMEIAGKITGRRITANQKLAKEYGPDSFKDYIDEVIAKMPLQLRAEVSSPKGNVKNYSVSVIEEHPGIITIDDDERLGNPMRAYITDKFKRNATPIIHQCPNGEYYVLQKASDFSANYDRFHGLRITRAEKE